MATLVTTVGYTPFFVGLARSDLLGAVVSGPWCASRQAAALHTRPALRQPDAMPTHSLRIRNPILPGSTPTPPSSASATTITSPPRRSSGFPGVQIHHSRDLVHWRLLHAPAESRQPAQHARRSGFVRHLGAVPDATPTACSHLIYTDVKRYGRTSQPGAAGASLRDFHNYLVTSPRIDGEWSDPISLNSSGFDPSLFHDDDGRKYLLNMLWDHRPGQNRFAGIVLQEYLAGGARAGRRAPADLHRHRHRLHRSAASLQAERLLLPADGRRRHGMGTCRHHGARPDR